MKKTVLLLTLCCVLIACKKNNVSFTYTPTEPRAGATVQFTNNSSSGEDWEWNFGDGSTSAIKSPSHVFRNPGTYLVSLKVDNKKSWMASKEITVYDTIPTFVASDSVFYIFNDYTFTANIYNPYNYTITYEWRVNDSVVGSESTLTTYFTLPDKEAKVSLTMVMNGITIPIHKSYMIKNRTTNSVLMRTEEADYRQRIFGSRTEVPKQDASGEALLDAAQDTVQTYNGKEFTIEMVSEVFEGIEGFHIANRKIYYRANGLWVANIDGANPVQIDTIPCAAMTLDTHDNRIYWANKNGVWYMPFVGSDNNKFVNTPMMLNAMTNVTKIAADAEPK